MNRARTLLLLLIVTFVPAAGAALPLWVLETGRSQVYLLGSIHALHESAYPLAAPIEEAYQQAKVIVVEVDLTRTSTSEMSRVMHAKGMFGPGESLDTVLSGGTRERLQAYLDRNALAWNQVHRMRPWLLNLTISQQELDALGFDPALGIDQHFLDRAYRDNKKVASLESFQQQIDVLANDSLEVQVAALRTTLESVAEFETQIRLFLDAWKVGDADQMLAMTMEPAEGEPLLAEQAEHLIFDRNNHMVEQIREYAASGQNTLVIVGALHMGGERGVIKLLQADYRVRQINE